MKIDKLTALITVAIVFGAGAFLVAGNYCVKNKQENVESAVQCTAQYLNQQLGFAIDRQPLGYIANQDAADAVSFTDRVGNPWVYSVKKESTSFASPEQWLEAQKKGGMNSEGFKPLLWKSNDTLLVEAYVVVDSDGKNDIYGKLFKMIKIERGKLYTITYRNWVLSDELLRIDPTAWDALNSFRIL